MVQSVKATYGADVPKVDETLYKGRGYTLAAAKCYAAAYAAAMCYRDNMAMQFFRYALMISNALTPEYPKDLDKNENEIIRAKEKQLALDSELQASQMAIASNYGLLTYLEQEAKNEPFLFINMYRAAHKACREAHDSAKDLRHSPIDMAFAAELKSAVEAIGVFYNHELAVWTEPVKAAQEGRVPELNPDTYIAETPEQRRQHSAADLDKLIAAEQAKIGELAQSQKEMTGEIETVSEAIRAQSETTKKADEAYEKAKEEMDALRRDLEKQSGKLSELSMDRSHLRVKLAVVDGDYFRLTERLQTIVYLRAYASQ